MMGDEGISPPTSFNIMEQLDKKDNSLTAIASGST